MNTAAATDDADEHITSEAITGVSSSAHAVSAAVGVYQSVSSS